MENGNAAPAVMRIHGDDTDELVRLRIAYLEADFGTFEQDEVVSLSSEVRMYLAEHLDRDLRIYGVRDPRTGRIVCCAWLLLVEKPPSPRFPHGHCGVLFNVYTSPEHRRRGLAHRVMESLVAESRTDGLDVLELHATEDGYPLYRGLGFEDDSSTHVAMRMMLDSATRRCA